jgi:hypothetical protein
MIIPRGDKSVIDKPGASLSVIHKISTPMENLREATASNSRLKTAAKKVKTFVLDTNVLLHDPQSIYKFEDNNLAIPVEVLEELDAIKGEQSTERGRNARRVHRILQELLPDSRSMHEGVKLPTGGTLSIVINPYSAGRRTQLGGDGPAARDPARPLEER